MNNVPGASGSRTQIIEILRHEIYPRDMKLMLFILLQMAVMLLSGLFGFNLRLRPDQRAIAEAEADMAFKCFLTSERVQLERDMQALCGIADGRQEDILRRSNERIDAWILRRYGKGHLRPVLHEEDEGWARGFLADVARHRALHPYVSSDPKTAEAVSAVLKRAVTLETSAAGS